MAVAAKAKTVTVGEQGKRRVQTKAVVFDLFGTLVHDEMGFHPFQHLMKRLDYEPDSQSFQQARRVAFTQNFRSLAALAEYLRPGRKVATKDLEEMVVQDIESRVQAYPDTFEVLSRLRRGGKKIGLISNILSPYRQVIGSGRLGLKQYFDQVIFSCDVGAVKPEPILYKMMIARLGMPPEEIVMIGDQKSKDCDAPKAAGMRALHLDRSGKTPGSVLSLKAVLDI